MKKKKLNWNHWWKSWANFQPKQLEAERALKDHDYILYGGSAGGGKSYFLRKIPIKFLVEHCYHKLGLKGVRVGLFCEDYPTLWDRHLNRIPYEFPNWLGNFDKSRHEFTLADKYGGGIIAFRNLDDPSKYLSSEFAMILVDELSKNKRQTFDFLRMRMRWVGLEKTKFIGASNPGGIGHDWVKKLWIDKKFDEQESSKERFAFIRAKATDNKFLSNSYHQVLDSLPEKMRKAYRDGNWDVFEGQFFTEWDQTKHVVQPFVIPPDWKRFRAYDHGRLNAACCLWGAVDYDGRVFIYRELYKTGLNVDQLAAEINRLSQSEEYAFSVADPSIFSKTGFVDSSGGQTIAETFARYGVVFLPASNRRVDGWNLMHQFLYWDNYKEPKLLFFSTCENAIRTIPALIHNDIKPEDVDSSSEDHAPDATRYLLVALHEGVSKRSLNETEKKLEEFKTRDSVPMKALNAFYYDHIS